MKAVVLCSGKGTRLYPITKKLPKALININNKKAIYYGIYDTDWFDSSATENFSADITDLIEVGDIVEMYDVLNKDVIYIWNKEMLKSVKEDVANGIKIRTILTKEQYEANCYKVKEEIC